MADIFLSYSRADYKRAKTLVEILESFGWTVWWDKNAHPGDEFELQIKQEIKQAKCVIAVWSTHSINSSWVKREAEEGSKQNKLIPVLIDDVDLPWGVSKINAANLSPWYLLEDPEEIRRLLSAVEKKVERASATNSEHHPKVYLRRQEIHWAPHNEKVSERYWACGTSLMKVADRGLIKTYQDKGVKDIKLILPSTDPSTLSCQQLGEFDRRKKVIHNQVEEVEQVYKRLSSYFAPEEKTNHLRRYQGILYSNITIFDDEAFISFYSGTGVGEDNITLRFDKKNEEKGYKSVEQEFLRMWDADPNIGQVDIKHIKKGASILFCNPSNQVLLFLRDNKNSIPFPNCWDALGGNVKKGESPLKCIIREMSEEIKIDLSPPPLFKIYNMDDRVEYTFWQEADDELANKPLYEGQKLQWFSEEDIRETPADKIAFGFKKIILEFFAQKPFNKL